MYFDYEGYVRECFNIPTKGLILNVIGVITVIIIAFRKEIAFYGKRMLITFIFIGAIESICQNVGQLYQGGIYLAEEIEEDAINVQGYITEMGVLGLYSLPRIECDYYDNLKYGDPYGYEFTINGIQCTAPTNGSLQVGDYVEVTYLPKSRYILYIDKTEEP